MVDNFFLPATRVAPVIARWRSYGNRIDQLDPVTARLCRSILNGKQDTVTLDRVDRLLISLDLSPDLLNDLAPLEAIV